MALVGDVTILDTFGTMMMTGDKPIFLLDIDGVLNAFRHQQQYRKIYVRAGEGNAEYPIRYSLAVIDRVTKMSERIEIHWCTTWEDAAVTHFAPAVGLPEFPVEHPKLSESNYSGSLNWWKFNRFVDWREAGRRVVWADDDNYDFPRKGPDELTIRPDSNRGLTMEQLQKIEDWI